MEDPLKTDHKNKSRLLQDVPPEIRVNIYKFLTYDERLPLRLVCQQTKEEIEEHFDFHVRLDQSYRSFRRLTQLRVASCTVIRLVQKNLPKSGIFKHPDRIKKLIFDGNISISNIHLILGECLQVEQLVFTHETLGLQNLMLGLKNLENLKQVTHINLQLLRYPLPDPSYNRVENMHAFLLCAFPKLTSFKLYFSVWGQWLELMLFLQRHATSLLEMELQVGDRSDTRNTEFYLRMNPTSNNNLLAKIDMTELRKLRLKEFQFRDDVLSLNPTVSNIFIEILKQQNILRILQFHSPGNLSLPHLQAIVRKNAATLEEVVVYNLKNDQVVNIPAAPNELYPPAPRRLIIDMTMFSECKNIRTLALSCMASNRVDAVSPIKMINLNAIPVTIERFHTVGFTYLGDDIINLSRRSPNLKELLMMDAGSMKYSSVISNVLQNCENLKYISIRPIVPRGSSDEAWWAELCALTKLYIRFMGVIYDPIDDLDGFEAHLTASDRDWIRQNITPEILAPKIPDPIIQH